MKQPMSMRDSGAALLFAVLCGASLIAAPQAPADVCGSVGGDHVDVSGCADPLAPPPPPPPPPPPADVPPPPPAADAPPPPPPPPADVDVCADVGRRVSVSGCV